MLLDVTICDINKFDFEVFSVTKCDELLVMRSHTILTVTPCHNNYLVTRSHRKNTQSHLLMSQIVKSNHIYSLLNITKSQKVTRHT